MATESLGLLGIPLGILAGMLRGSAPFLFVSLGECITEKSGKFGGDTAEDRREVLRWVLWDNHKLSSQAGVTRFLMNFLAPEKRPEPVIAWLQGRLKPAYQILDTHLTQRDWIVGRSVTNADFSCCGYLFYNEPFGFDRTEWPAIDRWLDRIAALDGWKHPYDLMRPAFPLTTR